jgi:hypothetical protein
MKPNVFIGSTAESLRIAQAVHANLQTIARCTVWNTAFPPSGNTLRSIVKKIEKSDFCIFVFALDDIAVIKGSEVRIVRDNVVFEMGISTGKLGIERSFFLVPENSNAQRMPTDLNGITYLTYESRDEDESEAATSVASAKISDQIRKLGISPHRMPDKIRDLANDYERCEWIKEMDERVKMKEAIFNEMRSMLKSSPVNKDALLHEHRRGFYIALAAAIVANPEKEDCDRIPSIKSAEIIRGNAQHKLLDVIQILLDQHMAQIHERKAMLAWAERLPDPEGQFLNRLAELKKRPL